MKPGEAKTLLKQVKSREEDQKALLRADDESMVPLAKTAKPSPAEEIQRLQENKRVLTDAE